MRTGARLFVGMVLVGLSGMAISDVSYNYDFADGAQGWTVGNDAATSLGMTSIDASWERQTTMGGTAGADLGGTWWVNPNAGQLGAERSWVLSPKVIVDATSVSINFDSYTSNEGGYPIHYDVEHVQISINGGAFGDIHDATSLLHLAGDRQTRNITFNSNDVQDGDEIRFRFLFDTADDSGSAQFLDNVGWGFGNVNIYTPAGDATSGFSDIDQPTVRVPEPLTLSLMGLGLAGIGYQRRKQRKSA